MTSTTARALPLFSAQEAIWTLEQLHPDTSPYHLPLALDLDGDLDVPALKAALAALLTRHPVLAGAVQSADGQLRMEPASRPPVLETTHLDPVDPADLDRLTQEEVSRPFDLEHGPLLHARLLVTGPRRSRLVVVAHHLVFDGASKDIFMRDLLRLYRSGGRPIDPDLPPMESLIRQEREQIRTARKSAEQFWRHEAPTVTEVTLPGGRRSPARWAGPAAACDIDFDPSFPRRLDAVVRATGATRFEVMLTILQTLLLRYGNESPLVAVDFGTRPPEARDSIGAFVNELPVRAALSPQLTVREAIGAVAAAVREVSRYRTVPLGEALGTNAASRPVPVSMSYRRRPLPLPEVAEQLPVRVTVDAAMFAPGQRPDLHLNVLDSGAGIQASLRYALDVLSEPEARRMATHVRELADAFLGNPQARLSDLPVMTAGERSRVLLNGPDTHTPEPGDTLHGLLARQGARTPEAIAVVAGTEELTYVQVHHRAGVLARRLASAGVGPESVVAVCAERSPELVVGLLAVLAAGAAFLPLDPELPDDRLTFMLRNSGATVVLTQPQGQSRLSRLGVPVVLLSESSAPSSPTAPTAVVRPENAAYVIYTSGSTGVPKGVINTHQGIVNRLTWMQETYQLRDDDAVLQKTPIGFDVSVWEFFWPLLTGARLVLCPPGGHRDPELLRRIIDEQAVTTVHFVPSMLAAFLSGATGGQGMCASLRRIICSGEELPLTVAQQALELLPGRLHNLYGPTEAAIDVSAWPCRPDTLAGADRVPIGLPIDNTALYVLDPWLRPVPLGVPGELCIGGTAPARGYLHRPGLTAERFLPDPYGEPGSRLYRTGDLARLRPDGVLEYLGRIDNQVKVSGVRIELGEVENALRALPSVRDAAAAVRDGGASGGTGDPRLVGYVVLRNGAPLDQAAARQGLRAWLPEQMVPSILVEVPTLPLSPNGKLDRAALPDPRRERHHQSPEAPARSDDEMGIGRVWEEVLGSGPAAADDDFFEAGGTSLLAVRMAALLRSRTRRDVTLRDVFDHRTPSALADVVRRARPADAGPSASRPASALPSSSQDRIPTTYLQTEHFHREHRGVATQAGISLLYRLRGSLDIAALRRSITALVQRHEVLRTSYHQEGDVVFGLVAPTVGTDVTLIDLSAVPAGQRRQEADRQLVEAADAPYDLSQGPVLRVTLVWLAADEHLMLLGVHHIASDDWAMQILTGELGLLYAAEKSGRRAALTPLPLQYRDYVTWQRHQVDKHLDANLDYWRHQLADLPPQLSLPGCVDPAEVHSLRRWRHELPVSPEALNAVADFSRDEGATPFIGVVAAFGMCLASLTGQDDVMIASLFAGRDRVEFEPVVGMFTDLTVFRVSLAGDPDFRQTVQRLRAVTLDAHQHKDIHLRQYAREIGIGDPSVLQLPIWNIWANATPSRRGRLGIVHDLALEGIEVTGYDPRTDRTQIKPAAIWEGDTLSLVCAGEGRGAQVFVEYNMEFFSETAARSFSAALSSVLEFVASHPSGRLSEVRRRVS